MAPNILGIDHQLNVLSHLASYDRLRGLHADARSNGTKQEFAELADAAIYCSARPRTLPRRHRAASASYSVLMRSLRRADDR